jgi:ribosomal protein S6
MNEDKKLYEIGYLVIPTLSDEQVAAAGASIRSAVTDNGGTVTKEEAPKFKRLAYEMNKKIDTKYETYDSAYFGYVIFEASADAVATIKDKVASIGEVLRFLLIKDPVLDRLVDAGDEEEEEAAPAVEEEKAAAPVADVSDEELDKSIDRIVGDEPEAEVK